VHRILLSLTLLSAPLMSAGSQILGRVNPGPAAWTSFGIGLLDMSAVHDKASNADWEFGQGLQYRVTLEKALSGQSGLGLVATYAQAPLTYRPASPPLLSPCAPSCDATANVWSVAGTFHMGGGLGLHQVIQFNAGATAFSNFRDDDSGDRLPPLETDVDLAFQVEYGLGFTINPRLQASLLQEFGIIVHPGNGEGSSSRTAQSRATRLSVRYGLGTKKPQAPGIRRR